MFKTAEIDRALVLLTASRMRDRSTKVLSVTGLSPLHIFLRVFCSYLSTSQTLVNDPISASQYCVNNERKYIVSARKKKNLTFCSRVTET